MPTCIASSPRSSFSGRLLLGVSVSSATYLVQRALCPTRCRSLPLSGDVRGQAATPPTKTGLPPPITSFRIP
ncbi:hypothetical protein EDB80DRAFT_373345 [Ilyonectria destructans]|nr:hypothetical protein EDB80DRAFT_373345 [Ilyonectria destructans]